MLGRSRLACKHTWLPSEAGGLKQVAVAVTGEAREELALVWPPLSFSFLFSFLFVRVRPPPPYTLLLRRTNLGR